MSTSQSNASAPSILSVKGASGVEIANGAATTETSVTIAGKAEQGQRVEVLDGLLVKGVVAVDASGNWTFSLTELSVGSHSIAARALYGAGGVSPSRTFTVVTSQ